ncbi:phosphoribosyl-ATP pyrophosphohydrolase [Patescibacteria group bacterium]
MPIFNKLVRDRIPEIITNDGNHISIYFADESEYRAKLLEKLREEVGEFEDSESAEELADIMEVLMAIMDVKGYTREQVEAIRVQKAVARGGFKKRIILQETRKI